MKLYIDVDDRRSWSDTPTWWRNLNRHLINNSCLSGSRGMNQLRVAELAHYSATLNYEYDPHKKRYVEFSDEKKMTMFLLKYS